MDQTFILALLSGPAVLLLDKLRIYLTAKWKANKEAALEADRQDAEQALAANEQALKIYKELVNSLKKDNERCNQNNKEITQLYIAAREENIKFATELAHINERVHLLEQTLHKQEADCQAKLVALEAEIKSLRK